MIIISKLAALFSVLYLVKIFLYPLYKPVSNQQKKRARRNLKERKNEKIRSNIKKLKLKLVSRYGQFLLGNSDRIRFKKIINRLDLEIKPEEIRVNQLLYSIGAIITTVVLFKVNPILGYVASIFIILGWLYPVDELEKKIANKNNNISLDFPSFYSMVYYQYSKSVNIFLSDIVRDYLPNANGDMATELGVMLDNIDYGEEYALKMLKKRVPLHYIIKFCDIMETRLKGYDNTSQMAYLKNEVDEFRIRALEVELKKRQAINSSIQIVLIGVLLVYIAIYYLFTILESLNMFQ